MVVKIVSWAGDAITLSIMDGGRAIRKKPWGKVLETISHFFTTRIVIPKTNKQNQEVVLRDLPTVQQSYATPLPLDVWL